MVLTSFDLLVLTTLNVSQLKVVLPRQCLCCLDIPRVSHIPFSIEVAHVTKLHLVLLSIRLCHLVWVLIDDQIVKDDLLLLLIVESLICQVDFLSCLCRC